MRRSFVIALVFLFTSATLVTVQAQELTRLRLSGQPKGTFATYSGSSTYLTYVEAEIRNVGSITAEGVRVNAALPSGESRQLSGPATLGSNKSAVYTLDLGSGIPVYTNRKIQVSFECTNCRR